jgi:hypothetical protein
MSQLKARHSTGPFSWKAALLFVVTGVSMAVYFQYEKARLERKRIAEMSKGVGRPKVGGPFALKDLDGKAFTDENLMGNYSLVRLVWKGAGTTGGSMLTARESSRSTSASPIARTFAPMSSTRWLPSSTR